MPSLADCLCIICGLFFAVLGIQCIIIRLCQGFHLGNVLFSQQSTVQMTLSLVQPVCNATSGGNFALDAAQCQVVPCFTFDSHNVYLL